MKIKPIHRRQKIVKVKVEHLTGKALDYAVALCEGMKYRSEVEYNGIGMEYEPHLYSTNWGQGGRIIEREGITLFCVDDYEWAAAFGAAQYFVGEHPVAATPLVAAMRLYVKSKFHEQVEIPEELL